MHLYMTIVERNQLLVLDMQNMFLKKNQTQQEIYNFTRNVVGKAFDF